jgi:uncharacterized membrane protein
MTTDAPHSPVDQTQADDAEQDGHPGRTPRTPRPGRRRFRGRIAVGALAAVVGGFILLDPARYFTFNANLGRLSPAGHPLYFPVLLVHVLGGTVAVSLVVLQIWPWLRRRHPRVHRYVGRVYVAVAWPAGLAAIVMALYWPFNPVSSVSDTTHAVLWLAATTYGFALARRRRFADHRRWMLRSFALCTSIIINRIVTVPMEMLTTWLASHLTTAAPTFPTIQPIHTGSQAWLLDVSAIDSWLCWTLALIAMEWWLDHERRRRPAPGEIPQPTPATLAR